MPSRSYRSTRFLTADTQSVRECVRASCVRASYNAQLRLQSANGTLCLAFVPEFTSNELSRKIANYIRSSVTRALQLLHM